MKRPRNRHYSIALGILAAACALQAPSAGAQSTPPGITANGLNSGWRHNCATLFTGELKCWGDNDSGVALGIALPGNRGDNPGEMGAALPAVDLGTGQRAIAVAGGWAITCVLLQSGQVKCWGRNGNGELGQGDTVFRGDLPSEMGDGLPPVDLGTGRSAIAVAAGGAHACAILDNGQVKCWGANNAGQLGQGDTASRGDAPGEMGDALPPVDLGNSRTATAIAAGWQHTCALLDNHQVKCWGLNATGQLGVGDTASRGDSAGEMGNALPQVALGSGRTARAIGAGIRHSCALLDNGQVKCWGLNNFGQLGLGDDLNRGDGAGEMGDALPAVDLGTGYTAIALAVGAYHSCVVTNISRIKCWGSNQEGQLGLGDINARGDNAGEMGDALPYIDIGNIKFKIITLATAVSAGEGHTCARTSAGAVKCWGKNVWGQLGLGDVLNRGDDPGEMGNALPAVPLF